MLRFMPPDGHLELRVQPDLVVQVLAKAVLVEPRVPEEPEGFGSDRGLGGLLDQDDAPLLEDPVAGLEFRLKPGPPPVSEGLWGHADDDALPEIHQDLGKPAVAQVDVRAHET